MSTTEQTSRVSLRLEPAAGPGGRWPEPAEPRVRYYKARLGYQGRYASFSFHTGSGWEREPVAREVLESVLSDSTMLEGESELDAAASVLLATFGEDGFPDADNPVEGARSLARTVLSQDRKLARLLGDDYLSALEDPEGFAWRVTDDPPHGVKRPRPSTPLLRRFEGRIGAGPEGPYRLEVELRATARGLELSVCGSTPMGGGQHRDALGGLDSFAPGWDAAKVARLAEVWERWHLNGLRAECEHQRAAGETYATHPGAECEVCGYRIGSAWLFEPISADVVAWLEGLAPELAHPDPASTFGFYTRTDQGSRFALEATFPELVGSFEHDRIAEEEGEAS